MNKSLILNIKESWKNIFNEYNDKFKKKTLNMILKEIYEINYEINFDFEFNNNDNNDNNDNNNNDNNDKLKNLIKENNINLDVFPKLNNIFRCFSYFELNETKILLLGQDPYHGANQATGLCFGIENGVPVPPSLRNIIKELKEDLNISLTDYSLDKWAKQNILLLNSSLSVNEGKPNSHAKIWSDFTEFIIEKLNNCNHSIIFVAWGAFAYNKLKNINTSKHYLIVSSHPSPLSVYKKYKTFPAFQGSKPFSQINEILNNNNEKLIIF